LEDLYLFKRLARGTSGATRSARTSPDRFVDADIKAVSSPSRELPNSVLRSDVEGFSYKEIAEIMDTSEP
jgi:RNA polymerase sigma-70 factor (ECF subfamily)